MHAILWFLAFAIIFYLLMRAGDGADMGTPDKPATALGGLTTPATGPRMDG